MLDNWIYFCVIPAAAGFFLDLLLGDPAGITHPVVWIGRLISFFERVFLEKGKTDGKSRADSPQKENREQEIPAETRKKIRNAKREFFLGCVTAVSVVLISCAVSAAAVWLACRIHKGAGILLACLLCWQMYAAKGLKVESMKVWSALSEVDVEEARKAVSMIVGRDTSALDEKGIIRAAVETVAENTSDGVIAPMFYMVLAGPVGAYFYKSVNTMDSMIGYRNEKYEYFGKCAARMDDALNFLPARISGILMTVSAALMERVFPEKDTDFRMSGSGAWKIFLRDRKKHASPNSAQTEAACAGALGIQLAGPAVYFGVRHEKPFIGDDLREIAYEDILRANRLMYLTSVLGISLAVLIAAAIYI